MEGSIINGAAAVTRSLEELGVSTVFGIPGIHNLDIYDQLLSSRIEHVTSRNESGAGFMALGAGMLSGKPGVALVITGPGLTNILTPMGEAYHDCVPILVISSQIPSNLIGKHSRYLHELENSTEMTRSVSKAAWRVDSAERIEACIKAGYELASQGRPGPVHIEIPLDVLQAGTSDQLECRESAAAAASSVKADREQLRRAGELLLESSRVALICGGGAVRASREVRELQQRLGAVVVTTAAGKGVVAEGSPFSVGCRLHFEPVRKLLESMDVVCAIGTQLSATDLWESDPEIEKKLIIINTEEKVLLRYPDALLSLHADTENTVARLLHELDARRPSAGGSTHTATLHAAGRRGLTEEVHNTIAACNEQLIAVTGIPEKNAGQILLLLQVLRGALPEDGVIATDMTTPAYAALSEWSVQAPAQFLHPVGFGALGYALPTAVGIKSINRGRKVLVLAGDGGFQFTLQELAVAVEQKLGLPIVIWNNHGYGEIRRTEDLRHPGRRIAVDVNPPAFEKLAEAYGAGYARFGTGESAADTKALSRVVERAFAQEVPTIIEIIDTQQ